MSARRLNASSDLSQWLEYLQQIHPKTIDLGLERTLVIAEELGLTELEAKVITVAGTNGKGSTCAMLEAILQDANYRVGVYSSPHLIKYNERVRCNGEQVTDQVLTEAFAAINKCRGRRKLSPFEFQTLATLYIFQQTPLDIVLLEVGLGGRFDATNVVEHDLAIITSLGLDHTEYLGSDLESIGYEKAGIFRVGKPAICGQSQPPASISAYADEVGAQLYQVGQHFQFETEQHQHETTWRWKSGAFELTELPIPNLPLANAATALMGLGLMGLDVSDVNIVNGLKNVSLAGRMQSLCHHPEILLDVAHNPQSMEYLASQLQSKYPDRPIYVVIGMLHNKDIVSSLKPLLPLVDCWYPTNLTADNSASAKEIALLSLSKIINKHQNTEGLLSALFNPSPAIQTFDKPEVAFDAALSELPDNGILLVTGSFHTVGAISNHWQVSRN